MSGTNETPAAAEPGPTAGTSAGVTETQAPADSSVQVEAAPQPAPEPATPEVVEATPDPAKTEDRAPSLLSEAKGDEKPDAKADAKPEEKAEVKAEAAPEVKEEPKAEEPKEEVKKEPPPPPTYDAFSVPDGVTLTTDQLGSVTGILGETESRISTDPLQAHAAMQEMGQKFVDLYVAESRAAAERYTRFQADNWNRTIEGWRGEFREDPDIGGNRADTSLARMGGLLEMYGQSAGGERLSKLRDVLTFTGAGDNPDMLRFVNWAASRLVETSRPVAAVGPRAPVVTSRAQRLYRNSSGAA